MPEASAASSLPEPTPGAAPRAPAPVNPLVLFSLALSLAAGTLWAMHGHVLRYPFLEDDYIFLTEVRRGLMGSIEHALRTMGMYFRPVSRELYFWAMSRSFGLDPFPFHLVNFGILLATVAMVAQIGRVLGGMRAGLMAAALYTLLPPHRVLLGYVSLSQDLLATGLACAATLAQVTRRRGLAGALLLGAMFSKESVVPLPLVWTLWEFVSAGSGGEARWRAALRGTWPAWLAMLVWGGGTAWGRLALADPEVLAAAFATSHLDLTPGGLWLGVRLTALTLVGLEQPWELLRATLPALRNPGTMGILGLLGAAALAVPGLLASRHRLGPPSDALPRGSLAALGLLWLLLLSVPPVLLGTRFNAYYVALPAVGFAWFAGVALARAPALVPLAACFALGIIGLLANATPVFRVDSNDRRTPPGISITSAWRLECEAAYVRRFRAYLKDHPPKRGTQLFLAQEIGFSLMGTSAALGPRLWLGDPAFDIHLVGSRWPDFNERPRQFARFDLPSLSFTPLPESLLYAIRDGSVALEAGRLPEAESAFRLAIAITRPGLHDWDRGVSFANLAATCEARGDSAAARRAWLEAVALPSGRRPALLALARLDLGAGRAQAAREWLRAGVASYPADPLLQLWLARTEMWSGDSTAAATRLQRLMEMAPAFADSVRRAASIP
jgi:hypothetical protein